MKVARPISALGLAVALSSPAWSQLIDFDGLTSNQTTVSPLIQGAYRFTSMDSNASFFVRNNSGSNAIEPRNFYDSFFQRMRLERTDQSVFQLLSFDVFPQHTRDINTDPSVPGVTMTLKLVNAAGVSTQLNASYPGHFRDVSLASTRFGLDFKVLGVDYEIKSLEIDNPTQNRYLLQFDNFSVATAVPEPATWALMFLGFSGLAFVSRRRHRTA